MLGMPRAIGRGMKLFKGSVFHSVCARGWALALLIAAPVGVYAPTEVLAGRSAPAVGTSPKAGSRGAQFTRNGRGAKHKEMRSVKRTIRQAILGDGRERDIFVRNSNLLGAPETAPIHLAEVGVPGDARHFLDNDGMGVVGLDAKGVSTFGVSGHVYATSPRRQLVAVVAYSPASKESVVSLVSPAGVIKTVTVQGQLTPEGYDTISPGVVFDESSLIIVGKGETVKVPLD